MRMAPDLRCFIVQGTECVLHPVMRALDQGLSHDNPQRQMIESLLDKLGGRRITRLMSFDAQTVRGRWLVGFCGESEGAGRFEELAEAAVGCFGHGAAWPLVDGGMARPGTLCETLWIEVIFQVARQHRPGLTLRAQGWKGFDGDTDAFFSVLPINPFLASSMLIDVLLGDDSRNGRDGGPSDEAPPGLVSDDDDATVDPHADELRKKPVTDDPPFDDLVTLDQAAAVVSYSKRALERYLKSGELPAPDIRGGGGKPSKWYWSKLRPALEEHFRPDLPKRFPASRFTG